MPEVDDRVRVASRKVDEAPRDGVVTAVIGNLLRIKWSTGEESTVAPGPGAVAVVGKVRASPGNPAAARAKGRQGQAGGKVVEDVNSVGRRSTCHRWSGRSGKAPLCPRREFASG